jgi:hypothetical protein
MQTGDTSSRLSLQLRIREVAWPRMAGYIAQMSAMGKAVRSPAEPITVFALFW